MRRIGLPATLVTTLGLALAHASFASDAPTFDEVDADRDGVISEAEAAAVTNFDFAAADTDEDAKLTREEYEAALSESVSSLPRPRRPQP